MENTLNTDPLTFRSAGYTADVDPHATTVRAANKAHDAIDKAAAAAAPMAEWLARQEKCISDNPLTSVSLAFGVGYLLSRVFR